MHHHAIKMQHAAEFRRCLIELDVRGVMKIWQHVAPHLAQPADELEALYSLHMARTAATTLPLKLRLYSKRWLNERGFGSFMPENIRQKQRAS